MLTLYLLYFVRNLFLSYRNSRSPFSHKTSIAYTYYQDDRKIKPYRRTM
jgi:hypothetical protein